MTQPDKRLRHLRVAITAPRTPLAIRQPFRFAYRNGTLPGPGDQGDQNEHQSHEDPRRAVAHRPACLVRRDQPDRHGHGHAVRHAWQGHYSIALPRDQIGTWRAGGRFKTKYNGEWYDLGLAADNDAAFATDAGAVRNFTLKISGERPGGGYYGGTVWPYFSSRSGNFDIERVEYTLTPIGPLIDGSAGQPLKLMPDEQPTVDVPIGRYKVTARYVPTDGPAQDMQLQGRDEGGWSNSTTITFHNNPEYGPFADFTVSLVPQP